MNVTRSIAVLFGPPTMLGMLLLYYEKRRSYQWREELCDPDMGFYPKITPDTNVYVRKINDVSNGTLPVSVAENPGLIVRDAFLTDDETRILSDWVATFTAELGMPIPDEGARALANFLRRGGLPSEYLEKVRYVSDRPEDEREPRALWGCGDRLVVHKLPLPLRALYHKLKARMPHLGNVRHIYIEHSPDGGFLRKPKAPKGFDGHEYVLIPLFGADGGVVSFSPTMRDLSADPDVVGKHGWTAVDLDVFVPAGAVLQVRSRGRFKWGWGVRPEQPQWFGNWQNTLPLGGDFVSLKRRSGATSSDDGGASSYLHWLTSWVVPSSSDPAKHQAPPALKQPSKARDMIVMVFEGPATADKPRKRWSRWEYDAYGELPLASNSTWSPDVQPSAEEIQQTGIIKWTIQHYPDLMSNGF